MTWRGRWRVLQTANMTCLPSSTARKITSRWLRRQLRQLPHTRRVLPPLQVPPQRHEPPQPRPQARVRRRPRPRLDPRRPVPLVRASLGPPTPPALGPTARRRRAPQARPIHQEQDRPALPRQLRRARGERPRLPQPGHPLPAGRLPARRRHELQARPPLWLVRQTPRHRSGPPHPYLEVPGPRRPVFRRQNAPPLPQTPRFVPRTPRPQPCRRPRGPNAARFRQRHHPRRGPRHPQSTTRQSSMRNTRNRPRPSRMLSRGMIRSSCRRRPSNTWDTPSPPRSTLQYI